MVWYGMVWYGMVWYGMVWYGMVWYGMVWYGMVWYGMVWYGMVCYHGKTFTEQCSSKIHLKITMKPHYFYQLILYMYEIIISELHSEEPRFPNSFQPSWFSFV